MRRKIALTLFTLLLTALAPQGAARATNIWPLSLELSAAPGEATSGIVRLTNDALHPNTYFLSVRDFFPSSDESGTPVFTDTTRTSERSMATWISFGETTIALAAGESREVHFTAQVPNETSPGEYYTALFFGTNETAGNVSVNTQVGALVFLNVTGESTIEGSLASFDAPRIVSHLPEVFVTRVTNSGQTPIVPVGSITITNMLGGESAQVTLNPDRARVLEGSTRRIETTWQRTELPGETPEIIREWKNFGFGYYRATLALTIGTDNQVINAETAFWIIPWQIILAATLLILIISLLAKRTYKRKR